MKKVFAFAALSLLVLASCKKDYTCTCVTTYDTYSGSSSYTITDTKSDAEAACNEGDESAGTYSTECSIS